MIQSDVLKKWVFKMCLRTKYKKKRHQTNQCICPVGTDEVHSDEVLQKKKKEVNQYNERVKLKLYVDMVKNSTNYLLNLQYIK